MSDDDEVRSQSEWVARVIERKRNQLTEDDGNGYVFVTTDKYLQLTVDSTGKEVTWWVNVIGMSRIADEISQEMSDGVPPVEDEVFKQGDVVVLDRLGIMGIILERLNEQTPAMYKVHILTLEDPKITLEIGQNYVVSGALLKMHTS